MNRIAAAVAARRIPRIWPIPRTVLAVMDQGLVSATGFATSVAIGRAGNPAELGLYAVSLSVILFSRGIQDQLISAPYLVKSQHQSSEDLPLYTGSNIAHQLLLVTLITVTILLVGGGRLLLGGPAPTNRLLLLVGALAPLLLVREYVRQISLARFQFKALLVLDAVACAGQLAVLGILVLTGAMSAMTALLAMAIANAVAALAWYVAGAPAFQIARARLWTDWLSAWSFGKWALSSFVVNSAAPLLMPWVMLLAISPEAAGVLAACTSLVGLANTFIIGVSNYLSPRAANAFATGGLRALQQVLRESALLFVGTVGVLLAAVAVTGDRIPIFVYGPEYAGTGVILLLLTVGALFNSLSITVGNGLWAIERPSANFRADLGSLTVAAVTTAALVPVWGIAGAAAASAMAPGVGALIRWHAYRGAARTIPAGPKTPLAAEGPA